MRFEFGMKPFILTRKLLMFATMKSKHVCNMKPGRLEQSYVLNMTILETVRYTQKNKNKKTNILRSPGKIFEDFRLRNT